MNDLETNRKLAAAIGWKEFMVDQHQQLWVGEPGEPITGLFDYRHFDVIWPIAKQYNLFPMRRADGLWVANRFNSPPHFSPEAAVALAVIYFNRKEPKP